MRPAIVFLAVASIASGIQYNGLRAKFGWSESLADKEYLFSLPRLVSDAEAKGWKQTERPPGPLPELRMYCSTGRNVCPLYDAAGFVAGLQVAIPVQGFEHPPFWKPEKKMVKWMARAANGEPEKEFWTATQYYVSEKSLKAGNGPTKKNGATLQDGGVWVAGPDGHLMKIPSTVAELNNTSWKQQNCIPNMGTHYHYNMTPNLNCKDVFPWFITTTQNNLVAVGFQIIGTIPDQTPNWFETYPKESGPMTIPHAPQCLFDNFDKYGIISLHVYFIDNPWTIKCKFGDSVKEPNAVDKLKVYGFKYVNRITDEIKSIFA